MPFEQAVIYRALERAGDKCEACGECEKQLYGHSATSFHLDEDEEDRNYYRITSTPDAFDRTRNRRHPKSHYLVGALGRPDDAFVLCKKCHKKVHHFARLLSKKKFPDYKGKNSVPAILEEVTIFFVAHKGDWTPSL